MTNKKEVAKMLGAYQTMFPNSRMTPEALYLYAEFLERFPIEQIRAGLKLAISKKKDFFPSVAEVLECIESLQNYVSTDGKGIPTASEAWAEVIKQANSHGEYIDRWKFSSPEVQRAIRRFGVMDLIYWPATTIGVARSHFEKIYNEELARNKERKLNRAALGTLDEVVNRLASGEKMIAIGVK